MKLEANKFSIELYGKILNVLDYGVIIANSDGEFIFSNNFAKTLFKERIEASTETRRTTDYEIYRIDKKTKVNIDGYAITRALRGISVNKDKMFVKNNKYEHGGFYMKVSSFPLYDKDKIEAAVMIFEDITKEQILYDALEVGITEIQSSLNKINQHNARLQ